MTDPKSEIVGLAERCEKRAKYHFEIALDNCTETAIDLNNIDRGLECLQRAAALRATLKEYE